MLNSKHYCPDFDYGIVKPGDPMMEFCLCDSDSDSKGPETKMIRDWRWYWWKFVHNALIHPFLALPWEPKWAQRTHDWTAKRCDGGG